MARILIVEDDSINAEVASLICMAARHTVTVVENGLEALLLLDAVAFDLVLTDIVMPRMDGLTMTGLIRNSDRPYANIPIVAMTAQASKNAIAEMIAAGINQVVTKPFRSSALMKTLDRVLGDEAQNVLLFRTSETREHPIAEGHISPHQGA